MNKRAWVIASAIGCAIGAPAGAATSQPGTAPHSNTSHSNAYGTRAGATGKEASDEANGARSELNRAVQVVKTMKTDNHLKNLLQQARGVFILTRYGRAALGVGGQGGEGVLVTRKDGHFGNPVFYNMGGVSIGPQAGITGGEVAFLLMSDRAVKQFESKGNFSINADAGLTIVAYSARGQGSAGKLSDVVVWSQTKGAYAGATVGITDVVVDHNKNRAYYAQRNVTPKQIIAGEVPNPHSNVLGSALNA